jgi:hypothetical protein
MVGARVVCRGRGGAPDHNRRRHSRGGSAARPPRRQQRLVALAANQSGVVGAVWLAGSGVWAFGLADEISTRIYETRHHYQLDRTAVVAGITLPAGAWISIDEQGRLYRVETAPDAAVAIDATPWRGDIQLVMPDLRRAGQGIVQSGILAADAVLQGTPCRAGNTAQFSDDGGELLHCTLAERSVIAVRSSRPAVAAARSR